MKTIKTVVWGNHQSGKSSVVAGLSAQRFNPDIEETIGAGFKSLPFDGGQLEIWDLAGLELFDSRFPMYGRGAALVVYCIDVSKPVNKDHERQLALIKKICPQYAKLIMVGTKADQASDKLLTEWKDHEKFDFITSAKMNTEIKELLGHLCKKALAVTPVTAPIRKSSPTIKNPSPPAVENPVTTKIPETTLAQQLFAIGTNSGITLKKLGQAMFSVWQNENIPSLLQAIKKSSLESLLPGISMSMASNILSEYNADNSGIPWFLIHYINNTLFYRAMPYQLRTIPDSMAITFAAPLALHHSSQPDDKTLAECLPVRYSQHDRYIERKILEILTAVLLMLVEKNLPLSMLDALLKGHNVVQNSLGKQAYTELNRNSVHSFAIIVAMIYLLCETIQNLILGLVFADNFQILIFMNMLLSVSFSLVLGSIVINPADFAPEPGPCNLNHLIDYAAHKVTNVGAAVLRPLMPTKLKECLASGIHDMEISLNSHVSHFNVVGTNRTKVSLVPLLQGRSKVCFFPTADDRQIPQKAATYSGPGHSKQG